MAPEAELRPATVTPLPDRLAVGRGTALFVDGRLDAAGRRVKRLSVFLDGAEHAALGWDLPVPGSSRPDGDYWWALIPIPAIESPHVAELSAKATLTGGIEAEVRLGAIELLPRLDRPTDGPRAEPSPRAADAAPLVAIAMATFEPPTDLFRRQIESIRSQTHERWVCVISDDASGSDSLEAMREVIGDDDRFLLVPAPERLGVYRNFERALSLVPEDADFVALCDQDDRWHEDKLEELISAVGSQTVLAYSDMRIVDREGAAISDTYWTLRRNNHTNFASIVLANTITGAASLFQRRLLDDVLPFPPRKGNAYHDHWIAQVAMALGEVSYVERPLYDYVQHGGASLGHLSANAFGRYSGPLPRRVRLALARVRQQGLSHGWRLYFDLYCRVRLNAMVLELRCGDRLDPGKRATLHRIRDSWGGIAWLGVRGARSWFGATETLGRERAMLAGLGWRRAVTLRRGWRRLRGADRPGGSVPAPGRSAQGSAASPSGDVRWLEPLLVDYFTRDGSTLMMRLLSSSPQVATDEGYPFEQKYFAYLWRWAQTIDRVDWPAEQWGPRALGSLSQSQELPLVGPPPWLPRDLIESGPGEQTMSERCFELVWGEFSRRAAERVGERHGTDVSRVRYYAEKHLNTWLVDLDRLPSLRLVVLLRDPRDTWVSINAFNRLRGSAGLGRDQADSDSEHLQQIVARQRERLRWISGLLERDEVPVIRYEDMVLDLEGVARALGDRLGIELDARAVTRDRDIRARHVSSETPERSIGRWRTELEPEVAEVFSRELAPELRAVGLEGE